ncbi:hypothetical protein ACLOJK_003569 [Asimina triloba]
MEGLIPFVLHALKNRKDHGLYRSLSDLQGSSRGTRLPLVDKMGSFDFEGSSHRRTRSSSDSQPPAAHGRGADSNINIDWPPASSSNYKPYDSQPQRRNHKG